MGRCKTAPVACPDLLKNENFRPFGRRSQVQGCNKPLCSELVSYAQAREQCCEIGAKVCSLGKALKTRDRCGLTPVWVRSRCPRGEAKVLDGSGQSSCTSRVSRNAAVLCCGRNEKSGTSERLGAKRRRPFHRSRKIQTGRLRTDKSPRKTPNKLGGTRRSTPVSTRRSSPRRKSPSPTARRQPRSTTGCAEAIRDVDGALRIARQAVRNLQSSRECVQEAQSVNDVVRKLSRARQKMTARR